MQGIRILASLKRKLGFWDVFCIASGAMISSGLFILPGHAYAQAGPAVVLAYALAAVLMIPAMFSQAELATAMPRSGGSYFFIERSMGALPGTLAGLANWLSIALKSAFALIGIGAFAGMVGLPEDEWTIKLVAIAFCVLFTVLNLLSVKGTGRMQVAMVAVLFAVMVVFLVAGFPAADHRRFGGFMDKGPWALIATAGLIFVSYGGLTKVASVAGEIHHPGRNIPAGMFAASVVVSGLYVAAVFVTVGVAGPAGAGDADDLSGSLTPLTLAAGRTALGGAGVLLLAVAAMLAFFTTANGGILSASRNPMAMSHDGLLPQFVRKISRFQTPWVSILMTSAFMVTIILALKIDTLVKVASTMMLVVFLLVNLAVLIMRTSRIQNYRPLFRSPMFPWFQVAGICLYTVLIAGMGAAALLTTAVFALLGLLWYVLYVRARISRESALVYMVRKAVSREIYRAELEEELREIALERDQVVHDRFDRLIQNAAVLDLPGPIDPEELFHKTAAALAQRLPVSEQELFRLFVEREKQSSTVIQPGLAIPHIIVPGKELFDVLLVRCREGVNFPGREEPVRVAFVLAGSLDERNYHLQALMAIAHVAGQHEFMARWLAAAHGENLRDLVLLSDRKRQH